MRGRDRGLRDRDRLHPIGAGEPGVSVRSGAWFAVAEVAARAGIKSINCFCGDLGNGDAVGGVGVVSVEPLDDWRPRFALLHINGFEKPLDTARR